MKVMNKNKYYTEEDDILNKYGDYASHGELFSIPIEYWSEFENFEFINQSFSELLHCYYDDLECYSLMYRDIDINLREHLIDLHDKAFFIQHKDKIIGYKNRILKEESIEAKVLQLYYKYTPMFSAFCRRHFGYNIYNKNNPQISYKEYIQIKEGYYGQKIGIKDLSQEHYEFILDNESEIKDFRIHYCPIFFSFNTKLEFVRNFFNPICFRESDYNFEKKHIFKYITEHFPNDNIDEIINFAREEIRNINKTRRLKEGTILSEPLPDFGTENWNIYKNKLEQESLKSNAVIEKYLFQCSKGYIWSHIYENKNKINDYLSDIFDIQFKEFWHNEPEKCKQYCKYHSACDLVRNFATLDELKATTIEKSKSFSRKRIKKWCIKQWISIVTSYIKELDEKERIENEKRMEKYRFNKRNAHARDKNIVLRQSDHIYMVNGITLDSVTTFVNNAFPKFNAEYHAKRKAEQLGISPEEVLDMWEQKGRESRELGTELHKKIENYYQGIVSIDDDKTFNLFEMFADKIELKPYRTEWAVYDLKHNIAGTIDFVDYQNGEYIIYDWKRSEKIIENGMPVKINKYGEKGNYPLEHLDNTPYYHYALQLSLYKYILEKNYGMKISDLRLGIFHPSYNKPYVLRMPYLEKEINDIFNLRSEVIF